MARSRREVRSSWTPDPRGNFLIALEDGQLVATHATTTGGPTGHRFVGRTAAEVYRAIVAAGLVSQLDHAAYLGAELARAEVALRAALPYRQDEPPAPRPRRPPGRRGAG
jgi:tetrahydromethanopterin S-methyltransferase subunit A